MSFLFHPLKLGFPLHRGAVAAKIVGGWDCRNLRAYVIFFLSFYELIIHSRLLSKNFASKMQAVYKTHCVKDNLNVGQEGTWQVNKSEHRMTLCLIAHHCNSFVPGLLGRGSFRTLLN